MGIFHRKFGLPVHVTARTLAAATRRCSQGKMACVETFLPGDVLSFGN